MRTALERPSSVALDENLIFILWRPKWRTYRAEQEGGNGKLSRNNKTKLAMRKIMYAFWQQLHSWSRSKICGKLNALRKQTISSKEKWINKISSGNCQMRQTFEKLQQHDPSKSNLTPIIDLVSKQDFRFVPHEWKMKIIGNCFWFSLFLPSSSCTFSRLRQTGMNFNLLPFST